MDERGVPMVMTPMEFTEGMERLGLTDRAAATALRCDERTVRRWRNGERPVPGPVRALVVLWHALQGLQARGARVSPSGLGGLLPKTGT